MFQNERKMNLFNFVRSTNDKWPGVSEPGATTQEYWSTGAEDIFSLGED